MAGLRHRSLGLDPLAAHVLMLLDGSRSADVVLTDLGEAIRVDPALAATLDVSAVPGDADPLSLDNLERLLAVFARAGLLLPDNAAGVSDGSRG